MSSIFLETFTSPFEKDTEEEALEVLNEIRKSHPESSGWIEVYGIATLLPNGKYAAVRKQMKVS